MKNLKKILFISLLTFTFSQAQNNTLKFKISSDLKGIYNYEKVDTLSSPKSKLDIYFYKNHFNLFYGVPKSLTQPELKNREIISWANENTPKELKKNWVESFKYDSEGKLIEYKYSGCYICSQLPWGYKLIYNENRELIEQRIYHLNQKNLDEEDGIIPNSQFEEEMFQSKVELTYDKNRNITQAVKYVKMGIERSVKLIEW
jgi:hypothetical protein